jgi:ArsR family transcriptional regulator
LLPDILPSAFEAKRTMVRRLGALAHPHRLDVFRALVVAGACGLTPGVMAQACGIAAATLSFHLKELMHAGLITQERKGRCLVYRVHFGHMNALLSYLTDNCCQGQPCAPEPDCPAPIPANPGKIPKEK